MVAGHHVGWPHSPRSQPSCRASWPWGLSAGDGARWRWRAPGQPRWQAATGSPVPIMWPATRASAPAERGLRWPAQSSPSPCSCRTPSCRGYLSTKIKGAAAVARHPSHRNHGGMSPTANLHTNIMPGADKNGRAPGRGVSGSWRKFVRYWRRVGCSPGPVSSAIARSCKAGARKCDSGTGTPAAPAVGPHGHRLRVGLGVVPAAGTLGRYPVHTRQGRRVRLARAIVDSGAPCQRRGAASRTKKVMMAQGHSEVVQRR